MLNIGDRIGYSAAENGTGWIVEIECRSPLSLGEIALELDAAAGLGTMKAILQPVCWYKVMYKDGPFWATAWHTMEELVPIMFPNKLKQYQQLTMHD